VGELCRHHGREVMNGTHIVSRQAASVFSLPWSEHGRAGLHAGRCRMCAEMRRRPEAGSSAPSSDMSRRLQRGGSPVLSASQQSWSLVAAGKDVVLTGQATTVDDVLPLGEQ